MKEFEKLLQMLPPFMAEARARSIAIKQITPGFLSDGEREAEKSVRIAELPGKTIESRFAKQETHGTRWAKLKPATIKARIRKGYGAAPILVNTGRTKRKAIADANNNFTLDNRVALSARRLGEIPEYLNDGTPRMPARPFYAPLDEKELKPIFAFAENELADYVYVHAGLL